MYYWAWMIAALVLLILETFTLSFYMLVIGVALFITGICDYFFQLPFSSSLVIASVMSVIGAIAVNTYRRKHKKYSGELSIEDDLDAGELVEVLSFDQNGLGQVMYRGAQWQARLFELNPGIETETLSGKKARIVNKEANLLIVRLI